MANVIIVDDSPTVVSEVTSFLKDNDIETISAATGLEGLEKITEHQDQIKLAIVDVNMPEMDGLTMIETLRENIPDLKTVFFMLTTEFDHSFKERGMKAGIKGWIVKPFNGEKAIGLIKRILNNG